MSSSRFRSEFALCILTVGILCGPNVAYSSALHVSAADAILLARAAGEDAFAPVEYASVTPYLDTENEPSAYAVELALAGEGSPVTVIVGARRDDVPVMMMWLGPPKHKDPDVLNRVAAAIWSELEVAVSSPERIVWLDLYEVWAVFPEINPITREKIICNLYSGRVAGPCDLESMWNTRMKRQGEIFERDAQDDRRGTSEVRVSSEKVAGISGDTLAEQLRRQWLNADLLLRQGGASIAPLSVQGADGPDPHTRYVEGVPNLDQHVDAAPDTWERNDCGDCAVVASMNILLFWDQKGYDRLVGDGYLWELRRDLRTAMKYDCGVAYPHDFVDGLKALTNSVAFGRQYLFDVNELHSFQALREEIDAGRPAMIALLGYDDPENSRDKEWNNHAVTAVGYHLGSVSGGGLGTNWVIVFDNWGGGDYWDTHRVDDWCYINWLKAEIGEKRAFYVRPGPQGVTYPNAEGIVWQPGQTQLITWNWPASTAAPTVELLRNGQAVWQSSRQQDATLQYPYSVEDLLTGSNYSVALSWYSRPGAPPSQSRGQEFTISWLAEAVDAPPTLVFNTSGAADWHYQGADYHSGGDAARSGNITNGQASTMQTTVIGAGEIEFWWKVSCEANSDFLEFIVDGETRTRLTGQQDWKRMSVDVHSVGVHTLSWRYRKDGVGSAGQDRGWVDEVSWTPDLPAGVGSESLAFSTSNGAPWCQTRFTRDPDGASIVWEPTTRSGAIPDNEVSWMQTIVTGRGDVSFTWAVSSEEAGDFLQFYIDGIRKDQISGTGGDWETRTFPIATYFWHTLTWRYVKNGSERDGEDCGWVHGVKWVPRED